MRMVKGGRLLISVTLCACAAAVASFPGPVGHEALIKKFIYNNNGLGEYSFEYETSDGTYRREEGGLVSKDKGMVVRGEYGYVNPEGKIYTVKYIADSNGFHLLTGYDARFNDRRII